MTMRLTIHGRYHMVELFRCCGEGPTRLKDSGYVTVALS